MIEHTKTKLYYAFIAVWATMALSAIGIFAFWNTGSGFFKALYWIAWPLGYLAVGYGFKTSQQYVSALRDQGYTGGKLLKWGFIVLLLCNTMSLTSLFGLNAALPLLNETTVEVKETLTTTSTITTTAPSAMGYLSMFAMLVFLLFPIFTTVSIYNLVNNIANKETRKKSMNRCYIPHLIFTILICTIFLPIILAGNLMENIGTEDSPTGYIVLNVIFYGAMLPWCLLSFKKFTLPEATVEDYEEGSTADLEPTA